ncbi:MAG: CHASE2 domain-containing protein, partial [Sulfurimicrobium sp.]|nr:CHASE2 domain-containing protein [Sulfurimicrobium sp.]
MRRLSFPPIVLLALGIALIAIAELSFLHWLLPLENRVSDYFVRTHALTLQADPDIVIVDIDEKSLASMADTAGSWPWPRAVHGELVEAIERQQPKAIVFDILFTDPDIYRPESDAYFNEAVAQHHNIYFPMIRLDPANDNNGVPVAQFAELIGMEATPEANPEARVALAPPRAIDTKSWRLGAINYSEDRDGIGRRYHVYLSASGWRVPSLPARLARDLGFELPQSEQIILGWRGGPLSHPHISYADLYHDASRKAPLRPQQELKGKIVIIGASAAGLHDIRSTPISSLHPALEILATAIDNLKNRNYLHAAPDYAAPVLTLALLTLLLLLFTRYHQTLPIGAALL